VQAWLPRVRLALPVLLIAVVVTSQGILYGTTGRLAQFGVGVSLIGAAGLATLLVATSVPGSIAARLARLGPLVRIGRRSYALYLFHTPVMWFFLHQQLTPFGRVLFAGPVLLALVALSWRLIERPAISFGHRFAYAPRASSGQQDGGLPEIDRAAAQNRKRRMLLTSA
jgi:peptidoglycan/LPS O-acetylase OafA/YrhL